MNIFKNRESIMGSLDKPLGKDALISLFQLAKQIRGRMGKQGYLLDCYLSMFLEWAKFTLICDVVNEGFLENNELQSIVFSLLDGTNYEKSHSIYKSAEELYLKQAHELPFQEEHTKLYLLMSLLADEMMISSTNRFLHEQIQGLNGVIDEVRFQELYNQISDVVGESMIEELNEKLKQRFLIVPMAAVYAQSMTDDLLYRLITRDCETDKQVFQLFMDILPDVPQEQ